MTTWFRRTPEAEALFAEEQLLLAATELVHDALHKAGATRAQLAEMLGVTPTEISQRLSGRRNLTLRSLARMMHALGERVQLTSSRADDPQLSTVGKRVIKHVMQPRQGEQVWSVAFRACIHTDGFMEAVDLKAHVDDMYTALGKLDHIVDATVDHVGDELTIRLNVEAEDLLQAGIFGAVAIRTAIHEVGGTTPGWERTMEHLVSRLVVDIEGEADGRELHPADCSA
ncbi:helix-turn-helix transcriptional regulator [Nocardia farcinica]|uniref:helix-turn-helix domain-containing protein n=1 Tax=Nocardia farcinica TaxID=37329 RepID=UPI0018960D94|nr:helix-turn-helix transcriptional regulator [Nocardia farcinica]MBF6420842.1 helix-turn-helix transcriptional regulator [Nocardia farcinica]MBF6432699.1 helix-turn-helix transcriptional regulator [Nocardia farcinica]MBF6503198.1 helix-turn-helix transcriptional regulator [Nocardia farcinica]